MDLEDYPVTVRPMKVIEDRLVYQSEEGEERLLDGISYDREGVVQITAKDILPLVQNIELKFIESISEGAPSAGDSIKGNTVVKQDAILSLLISGRREYGFFQRESEDEDETAGRGVMEWIARVQDAIEWDHVSSTRDARLLLTLDRPVSFEIRETFYSDLSISILVDVRWQCRRFCRSSRVPV